MSEFKVFKTPKDSNYTVISNEPLVNRDLSNSAVGLLAKIMSLPADWNFSIKGLVEICGDGERSVRSTLKELEEKGYMAMVQDRDRGSISKACYIFYESVSLNANAHNANVQNANVRNADVQNANERNEAQLSTNKSITQESITHELSKQDEYEYVDMARTREDDITYLVAGIERILGRSLEETEYDFCNKWINEDLSPDYIFVAVKDNTFRRNFSFYHVQQSIDEWQGQGIRDALAARNFILDRHAKRLLEKISRKANGNEKYEEELKYDNEVLDLQGTRDLMIEMYQIKHYDTLIEIALSTRHKDINDYLPPEIVDFIRKNKDCYGYKWDGPNEKLTALIQRDNNFPIE